jgi:hypothetical protein
MVLTYSPALGNKRAALAMGGHSEVKYSKQKRSDGSWRTFFLLFWGVDSGPRDVSWCDVLYLRAVNRCYHLMQASVHEIKHNLWIWVFLLFIKWIHTVFTLIWA